MKGHKTEYKPKGVSTKPPTWHLYFDLPRLADGKRRPKCCTFKGTGRQADQELARLVTEAAAGKVAPADRQRTTVEQYLTAWLERREGDGLSPKTLETWRDFARAYIYPHLGRAPLAKLTAAQVEEFYSTLRKSGRRRGEGGLLVRFVNA